MLIHYYHQFYAGPNSPGPAQPRSLVRRLAERGHRVDVIACDCNAYNEQTEPAEDWTAESGGRVTVHRLPVSRNLRASLMSRLRSYGGFACSAYRYGRRLPAPDVVMTSIQPLFGGYAAMLLARRWKKPFLLEIRDLWPDALVVKKVISNWQAWPLQKMAKSLYFGADRVVSLTPGIKTELLKKGVPAELLDVFPNGFDKNTYDFPDDTRSKTRARLGWGNQFVAVYTGTHTEVTAIDVIVRAAASLRHRQDIRIDLFGSGQSKAGAMSLAQKMGLDNIFFHDPVPKSQIPSILAGADLGIMTLFHSPLIHIYFENKFIDYMGAGKPIAAAMEGVQAEIITKNSLGRVVPAFDYEGLGRLISDAADNSAEWRKMAESGHLFVSNRLDQSKILDRYVDTLESLARGDSGKMASWDPFQERN